MDLKMKPWTRKSVLQLDSGLQGRIGKWAAAGYPFETCGLLLGRKDGVQIIVERAMQVRNVSRDRLRDRYLLDPNGFLKADQEARRDGLDIVGIWHSHPDHRALPSPTDLQSAWEGYSYLIASVTDSGVREMRSFRLHTNQFVEEELVA